MSTESDTATELYLIQAATANLQLQLEKLQAKIAKLETAWDPLQLAAPASAVWRAAGLAETAELDSAIHAIEDWIFLQPNYETQVAAAGGWLNFLYGILGPSIRIACKERIKVA